MSEVMEVSQTDSLLRVIQQASVNPDVDVDKMERLFAMVERIQMRDAETAFNGAMSAAQSEMGRVSTDANNPQTRSKYASYGKLDSVLRPIYTRHGFALSFNTGATDVPDVLRVECLVSHGAGFARSYHIDMPADGKGAKGGDVMTKTHATGAAASYGMRYLLKMIFNVAIGEEDTDGNSPVGDKLKTITDEQEAIIREYLAAFPALEKSFLGAYKIDSPDMLPASKYEEAVARFKAKVERGAK